MEQSHLNIHIERDELGRNIGGAIPKGATILIEGSPGTGKSIIVQRLVYGLLENGHTASYISTELNLLGFVKQMNSLAYPCSDKIIDESLLFLSLIPQVGKTEIRKNMIFDLLESKKVFEKDCIVVDMVTDYMVDSSFTKEDSFRVIQLLRRINSLGKTVIFCAEEGQISQLFLDSLRTTSDVYFMTEAKMVLGAMLRILNVKRFKLPAGDVTLAIAFKVLPGAGFSVEIASLS